MDLSPRQLGAPQWLVLVGAGSFGFALAASAYWDASIRWLHFFQAGLYLAIVALSVRGSRWGDFCGISVAGLWNYSQLFVSTFFLAGLHELTQWIRTGYLARPDLLIAVPAWAGNLLIIIGCAWAYARRPTKPLGDVGRLLVCFTLTTLYLYADIALFWPPFLTLFPRLLHPHLP
jgi:hypothetical protein